MPVDLGLMLLDWAKSRGVLFGAIVLPIAAAGLIAVKHNQPFRLSGSDPSGASDTLTKMREALSKDRSLLAQYEREQANLRAEVIRRRKLYQDGQISKPEVEQAEQAFVAALNRVHEMRHSVIETDIAISEAVLGEKVERMPALPVNGFSETADVARFNGSFRWSLREAPRIEKYFSETFGRRLPVTALGQSETHNRLGFDHHDSMDVAVHPDSAEGRALIDHLRSAGIPFIAFRGAVPGTSTGPHIHIGKPSSRLARQ
jgi:hypothetical protein